MALTTLPLHVRVGERPIPLLIPLLIPLTPRSMPLVSWIILGSKKEATDQICSCLSLIVIANERSVNYCFELVLPFLS